MLCQHSHGTTNECKIQAAKKAGIVYFFKPRINHRLPVTR